MHRYEITRRESHQHRAGHFTLLVDGLDAEVTVDPSQFAAKALREAMAEGLTAPDALLIRSDEIAAEYAARALERRVERLRAGSLIPGGIPFGIDGQLATQRINRTPRRDEAAAVEAFLNRGLLCGLTKQQRAERVNRPKVDCDDEWRKNRLALIARREEELRGVLFKLTGQTTTPEGTPISELCGPLLIAFAMCHVEISTKSREVKFPRVLRMLCSELKALRAPILCASHGFQYAYTQYLTGTVNLASDDIRIWPLMTNTTVDTERDAKDQFSDFTTVDEFDGANYSSGGLALDSQAVAVDDANDRAEFDAADETVASLGAGTRSIQGVCLGKFNTNTASSMPLHWIEFSSNRTPDGGDFTFQFNAEGILQAADG